MSLRPPPPTARPSDADPRSPDAQRRALYHGWHASDVSRMTDHEVAALVDAYAVVKCVAQLNEHARFLVVVNRVGSPGRGELAFQRLTEVARQHVGVQLHYLGEVPDDDAVMQQRLGQLPLVATDPEAPTSRAVQAIVAKLVQVCGGLQPRMVDGDDGIEARFRKHRLFL